MIKKFFFRSFLVKGTFPQYKPPETHSLINTKLDNDIIDKMKSFSQKNFLIENIKNSKNSPEKKTKKQSGKSIMIIENNMSKTSFLNKENSFLKSRKSNFEKLDPLVMSSFKLKTYGEGGFK